MNRIVASLISGALLGLLSTAIPFRASIPSVSAQGGPQVAMLNQAGDAITTLTDGALVRFSIELAQPASVQTTFAVALDDTTNPLATCRILRGTSTCTTRPIGTLGWYWEEGKVMPTRLIRATNIALARDQAVAALAITVKPRPVVMIHGFNKDFTAWLDFLGPSGYLALTGLQGFAVGDGQVAGAMSTGNLFAPTTRTNTIALNAAALGEYIDNVKALTGAEQVDLIAHSMGGLIARYYIDRVMETRDVAQLIMLATPNGGSNCAVLVDALGLYEPASLELREDYVRNVFNPQITAQHDIPFYAFAGTPIQQKLLSPCSKVPNDLVVSLESATILPIKLIEVPFLHIRITHSLDLYMEHIAPLLRQSRADFAAQDAQPSPRRSTDDEPLQYSQVFTGVVANGVDSTQIINIDSDVAVASFGLYDPSRTLTVTVRGATGNVISLSAAANGLTVVNDPASLLYLGYGFENPRPGPWQVTLHATSRTPPLGTEYAIVTQYVGGAAIDASLSNHLPGLGEEVELTAVMNVGDEAVASEDAQIVLHHPNGVAELIEYAQRGNIVIARFSPEQVGVYGIDIVLRAVLPDDTVAERATYLALEAFRVAP